MGSHKKILILVYVLTLSAGCISHESAYTLGGAMLGGLSGTLVSANNPKIAPLIAAGGAAAGGIVGALLAKSVKSGHYGAFQEGYQRGASDTVKRQYWILQNVQKEQNVNKTDLLCATSTWVSNNSR